MRLLEWQSLASWLLVVTAGGAAAAQSKPAAVPQPPAILSISVCSPGGLVSSVSCDDGTLDTQQIVLGLNGQVINSNGVHGATDEHASVFPPDSLGDNTDYLFFVASGSEGVNPDIGALVLTGGAGPDSNGQWTMDFAPAYGSYPIGFGQVFLAPFVEGQCPSVDGGTAANQDQTFDLGYAAPGSVVKDPTSAPGSLLMVYEGANTCINNPGGPKLGDGSYESTAIATSNDYGHTWPTYRAHGDFEFVPLPKANNQHGPQAPFGAYGAGVCVGNDCSTIPPDTYGRYPVLMPPTSLDSVMQAETSLGGNIGDSEPSAFVDEFAPGPDRYVYAVHTYIPTPKQKDLALARAQLNGGGSRLSFAKWDGQFFAAPGIGGDEAPLLPVGDFANCGDPSQSRSQGSLSYVEQTQQYLLVFVCNSPTDPTGRDTSGQPGSAWFFSTSYDLSDPHQWTTPQPVTGSWNAWDNVGCPVYNGWYPTLMSLDHQPGRLTTRGYVFYLWGCLGAAKNGPTPERQYSSRAFTITTK